MLKKLHLGLYHYFSNENEIVISLQNYGIDCGLSFKLSFWGIKSNMADEKSESFAVLYHRFLRPWYKNNIISLSIDPFYILTKQYLHNLDNRVHTEIYSYLQTCNSFYMIRVKVENWHHRYWLAGI